MEEKCLRINRIRGCLAKSGSAEKSFAFLSMTVKGVGIALWSLLRKGSARIGQPWH